MKRSLLVLRHGKSDWNASYGSDHQRPLAPRGESAARAVGRFLARIGVPPELVLSSTAVRARRTVELAAEAGGWSCPMRWTDRLYDASPATVLEEIAQVPDSVGVVLVAGHQPTWGALIAQLTGARVRFPTAALGCVRAQGASWRRLGAEGGELAWLVTPKILPGGQPT